MEVNIKWSLSTSSLSSLINTHQQQNAGRCVCVCMHAVYYSLKEVVSAVEFALSREALLVQRTLALGTLHTLDVPGLVQYFHKIALHDRLVTASAHKWSDHLVLSLLSSFARSLFYVNRHELQSLGLRQWYRVSGGERNSVFSRSSGLSEIFKFQISHARCDSQVQDCASSNWNMSLLKENSSQSMTLDTVSLPPR